MGGGRGAPGLGLRLYVSPSSTCASSCTLTDSAVIDIEGEQQCTVGIGWVMMTP